MVKFELNGRPGHGLHAVIQRIGLTLLTVLAVALPGYSSTLNVPGSFSTIQAGINAASNGDTVLVANGTYSGSGNIDLDFGGKLITVKSANGAALTIINCGGSSGNQHRGFSFHNAETSSAIVKGFTIENGYQTPGGGITITQNCNPTIDSCVFLNNTAPSFGGAICAINSSPKIIHCTFNGNHAGTGGSLQLGGAIEIQTTGSTARTPEISDCVFVNNSADDDGGAIDITGSTATVPTVGIDNCSFFGNTEAGHGETIDASHKLGVIDFFNSNTTITDSILYGDTSGNDIEISTRNPASTLTVQDSDVQGGAAGSGNRNEDPNYVNSASGDLHLLSSSSEINHGITDAQAADDLDGFARTDGLQDIGAFEYRAPTQFTVTPSANPVLYTQNFNVTVTAKDANGNLTEGYLGTVSLNATGTASASFGSHTFVGSDLATFTFSTLNLPTPGSYTLTASAVGASGTAGLTVSPGVATHFTVSAPSSVTSGSAFSVTVTALDAANHTATSYAGTVHFTSTDGAATLPANTTLTSGTGTFSATLKTVAGGTKTITATDTSNGTINGTSGAITVNPGAATHFTVSAPSSATGGSAFSFTVTALDQFNNTATGYAGTVHFTSSDGSASLPVNSTLTNGTGTFSATLSTGGNQTITATDTSNGSITGTSGTISVSASAATHFTVSAPGSATAGSAFSFTVTALDASNNTVLGYSGTVHFTSSDGAAVLPANSTLTNGVGTFSATLKTAGNRTITATDTSSGSITGTSGTISVSASVGTHFTVSAPGSATAGSAFSFTVTALDQFNNTATGYSGIVHFSSSDGSATLPANSTLTNGVGTFSATLNTAGSRTITAMDTLIVSITATSGTINVSSAGATHILVTGPSPVASYNTYPFTYTALDQFNNVVTGYNGTVHLTSSDPGFVNLGDVTLVNGVGQQNGVLKTAGDQTITATDTSNSSITGTGTFHVVPGAVTRFNVSAPASVTAGSAFSFTVTALDLYGNTVTGYSGTAHFSSSDGGASLPANSTLTNGVGTFSATLNTAGSQTITATDASASSVTGTSGTITVTSTTTYTDVSGAVRITLGAITFNHTTGIYSQTVMIKNKTSAAIPGPIQLVLNGLSSGAVLTNKTGTLSGSPYITAKVGGLAVGPFGGESVSVTLKFTAPSAAITYTPQVLSGTIP